MDLEKEAPMLNRDLYPYIEPYSSGFLKVSDLHALYWEQSGNPNGHVSRQPATYSNFLVTCVSLYEVSILCCCCCCCCYLFFVYKWIDICRAKFGWVSMLGWRVWGGLHDHRVALVGPTSVTHYLYEELRLSWEHFILYGHMIQSVPMVQEHLLLLQINTPQIGIDPSDFKKVRLNHIKKPSC